jgi:hypothetical protein
MNLIEPQLAPVLFQDARAFVPKLDFSPKTIHDERFELLDRHIASGALRAFRHYWCHETSIGSLKGRRWMLKLSVSWRLDTTE